MASGAFLVVRAQQPDTPEQTPEPMPADDATQSAVPAPGNGAGQSTAGLETEDQTNQPSPGEELIQKNGAAQTEANSFTNSSGRHFRRSYRRRPGTGSSGSAGLGSAASIDQTTNGRASYTNFSIVLRNNIFDPNRRPGSGSVPPAPTHHIDVESFTLRGTASLGTNNIAVFDGTSSEYHKDTRVAETIAGYTVAEITPDLVKLTAGTNEVELRVGMQMRREAEGPWMRTESSSRNYASVSTAASSPTSANVDASLSGPAAEILKRLMKQREQE